MNTSEELREQGFTFLEIMIVVIIIGMLMTLVATNILSRQDEAKVKIAQSQIHKLAQALEFYRLDNGRYPTTEQGLQALVTQPTGEPRPKRYPPNGYGRRADLIDPWQSNFHYEQPGQHNSHSYDLYSFGTDGLQGGEGTNADIGNWDDPANL